MGKRKFETGDIVCINDKATYEDKLFIGKRTGVVKGYVVYGTSGYYKVAFDFSDLCIPLDEHVWTVFPNQAISKHIIENWEEGYPVVSTALDACIIQTICDDLLI